MGRRRIPDEEKMISFTINIKKIYLDKLKKLGSPSKIINNLLKEFLEKKE